MVFLWNWIRWLFGYVIFEIRGAYGEKFITLSMKEEVDLWEIRRVSPGIIRAKAFLFSRKRLDLLARKSGVTLEYCSAKGLPQFLKRYRLRPGLFLGGGLYVTVLILLSCFVWSVEIPNADPIRAAQIRSVLLEEGFGVGTFSPSVDYKELKYRLMLSSPEISFVSVNMEGVRAVVDVRFASQLPEKIHDKTPCNIVASRDGQIVSMLVLNGVRYAQKGQTVQKGDLLVGGIVNTRLGYYVVHSKAQVFARVTDVESETVSFLQTETVRTGRVKVKRVWNFFGTELDLSPGFICPFSEYETVVEKKHLSFGDSATVPITLTETYYYETSSCDVEISSEQAESMARARLDEIDRIRLCGTQVESVSETVSVGPHSVTVTRTRSLIVDISEEKEFYFEDEGS